MSGSRSSIRARAARWLCAVIIAQHAESGLRDYAHTGLRIGSQATASIVADTFPYHEIVRTEFNIITDDRFKMGTMQPSEGVFSFTASDTLVNWALSNGLEVRGHALEYYQAVPQWMQTKAATWTREEAIATLSNHITTVVSHFRGRVKYYDVVNEIVSDAGARRENFWSTEIGPEYVDMVFAWAHAADPDAILYWNEQRCEGLNTKSAAMVTHLQNAQARGVPVHGFGTQAHVALGEYTASGAAITSNLNRFAALGLETQITECDVRIYADDGVTREEILQQQRDYENIVAACRAASNCTAFVMWGFSDNYSWIPNYKPGYDEACIYNREMRRKPAYYGVRNALLPVAVEFRFDEAGAWSTNSGRDVAIVLLAGTNGAGVAARTDEGAGVSGRPYDWAFHTLGGSVAGVATGVTALAGAASWTVAGWYRVEEALGGAACVMRVWDASNNVALLVNAGGQLQVRQNGAACEASAGVLGRTGAWVFVAAAYDGTRAESNVWLYAGTRAGMVEQIGVGTVAGGAVWGAAAGIFVGAGAGDGQDALRGQIDCVRVLGAAGSGGAVSRAELDALRRDDGVQALPELLHYNFNETGSTAGYGGFLPYRGVLLNSAGNVVDLHSAEGEGISQLLSDRAFDNTASAGMGAGFTGGRVEQERDETPLDRVVSFTYCGWIKPAGVMGSGAVLLRNQETTGAGFSIGAAAGAGAGDIAVNVDGQSWQSAGGQCAETDTWVFVAASYDGSRATNNVRICKGGRLARAECVGEGTLDCGRTEVDTTKLMLGGTSGGQQPFDGMLDEVRLYASKFDGSGVLSVEELEGIRAEQAVPEAGLAAALGLLGLLGRFGWRGRMRPVR